MTVRQARSKGKASTGGLDRRTLGKLRRAARGELSTRLEDRICYSFDATDLRALPDAVVWPRSTEDVVSIVRAAHAAAIPVVPRGAGTGYTGGCLPVAGGVVVSTEKMGRVLAVDAARRVAVVEPGVVNEALRARVEALGLSYPPDPASHKVSTIGGNVAEGAGGPRTVLHGATRDYVVGLEVVLADGSLVTTGALARGAAGWDPGPLFVASEGTLGVVTKTALRLTARALGYATCWVEFPSLERAATMVAEVTAAGLPAGALEVMDAPTLACALEHVTGEKPESVPDAALLVEFEGEPADLVRAAEMARSIARANDASTFREARTDEEREGIWEIRRSISPSLARMSGGKINEDITVPRSAIPEFVRAMREISAALRLPILAFGHAGDGNLHVNVMVERDDPDQMGRARDAVSRLFARALGLGGTLSGEHGIGITKAEHLSSELDDAALRATRAVKRALDPSCIMNPDKILTDRANPWWDGLPPAGTGAAEPPSCS